MTSRSIHALTGTPPFELWSRYLDPRTDGYRVRRLCYV